MGLPKSSALLVSEFALALVLASCPARADDAAAEAYRSACAECHATAGSVARRFAGLAPDERRRRWEAFLARHHGGEAERRAAPPR